MDTIDILIIIIIHFLIWIVWENHKNHRQDKNTAESIESMSGQIATLITGEKVQLPNPIDQYRMDQQLMFESAHNSILQRFNIIHPGVFNGDTMDLETVKSLYPSAVKGKWLNLEELNYLLDLRMRA